MSSFGFLNRSRRSVKSQHRQLTKMVEEQAVSKSKKKIKINRNNILRLIFFS